jgi:DNA-binding IclR family transcriptional regulator
LTVETKRTLHSKFSEEAPEELRILDSLALAPKSVDEISMETNITAEKCSRIIEELIDVGLIRASRDSDAYGHETIRYKRSSRAISSFKK